MPAYFTKDDFLIANSTPARLGRELADMLRFGAAPAERAVRFVEAGADLNAKSNNDWRPLHSVAGWGGRYREVFNALARRHRDPAGQKLRLDARDSDFWTPLIRAAFMGEEETALGLCALGANAAATAQGRMAEDFAARRGYYGFADKLAQIRQAQERAGLFSKPGMATVAMINRRRL